MAVANIVVIPDRYTCRGLTFLPNGQQYAAGVPAGEYDVLDECDLCYTDLGQSKRGRAVMIVNIATGEKWYVGVEVAAFLERDHKRPPLMSRERRNGLRAVWGSEPRTTGDDHGQDV